LIFGDELDGNNVDGDPKKRFACDGLDTFNFSCSTQDGDMDRASKLKQRKSLMGLGEREY
jgi:hypothetical protein